MDSCSENDSIARQSKGLNCKVSCNNSTKFRKASFEEPKLISAAMDERLKKRLEPFQFSKPSREEKRFKRQTCVMYTLILLHVLGLAAVIYYHYKFLDGWKTLTNVIDENGRFNPEAILLYLIVVLLNFFLLYPVGMISTRAIVFPYSCCIPKNVILGSQANHYSNDFKMYAEKCYIIM